MKVGHGWGMMAGLLLAAMLGGGLSHALLSGVVANAQDAAAAPATVPMVAAQEFRLVDAMGHMRGRFSMKEDGSPSLTLFDAKGMARLALIVSADSAPGVLLFGPEETVRATLALAPSGPGLSMLDMDGKPRVSIAVKEDGSPQMQLLYDQRPVYFAPLW